MPHITFAIFQETGHVSNAITILHFNRRDKLKRFVQRKIAEELLQEKITH